MNYQDLHRLILDIDSEDAKVAELAHYCFSKSNNDQRQIAKKFESFLRTQRYTMDFKLKIVEVMSYIMLQLKGKKFIRHFCVRIKSFLANNSIQIAREDLLSQKVIELFNKWKDSKVFADSFMKIIRQTASSILGVEEVIQASPFVKYSKSYLMAYSDVSKVSEAMLIYKTICEKAVLIKKIQELKKQIEKDESEGEKKEHTTILLKQCQAYVAQLVKVINSFQKTTKNLCRIIKEEATSLQIPEEELIAMNDH